MTASALYFRKWKTLLLNWEYWPSIFVYGPVLPYLGFLWMKARSCFFFNAANPGIPYGGFTMESKWQMYQDAPSGFFPLTQLVQPGQPFAEVQQLLRNIPFPLYVKPDIGAKGAGVAQILTKTALAAYHRGAVLPYLLQTGIALPEEVGVFYVRIPGEKQGRITGIVQKHFMQVRGDGRSSIRELLLRETRYQLQHLSLEKEWGSQLHEILPLGEELLLRPVGNHARGALFKDVSFRINEQLTQVIDQYCQQYKGFYFGRLDIRFQNWERFYEGKDFAVIELNGAGSEPTHIYDPEHSLWFAWKEIIRHWNLLYQVSSCNYRSGFAYLTFKEGVNLLYAHHLHEQQLKQMERSANEERSISFSV